MIWLAIYAAIGAGLSVPCAITRNSPTPGELLTDFAVMTLLWPIAILPNKWQERLF